MKHVCLKSRMGIVVKKNVDYDAMLNSSVLYEATRTSWSHSADCIAGKEVKKRDTTTHRQ
jgi:hypothetical protein